MSSKVKLLLSIALGAAFSLTLAAQQSPAGFHSVTCIKVTPGKAAEFHKFMADDVRKFQQVSVDAGRISTWFLLRSVIPVGSSASCDYLSVALYPAAPPAPMNAELRTSMLKKSGLAMTSQELIDRGDALSHLVSQNLFQNRASVGTSNKGDYFKINYMKVHNMTDYLSYEQKVWTPISEQLIKDGVQNGWSENVQVLPTGSDLKFEAVTVDVYPSWDAAFKDWKLDEVFKKVHPDMEIGTTFDTFEKLRTIISTELFVVEEKVTPSK
jgi:hypothetical protein